MPRSRDRPGLCGCTRWPDSREPVSAALWKTQRRTGNILWEQTLPQCIPFYISADKYALRGIFAVKSCNAVGGIDHIKADGKKIRIYDALCTADIAEFSAYKILQEAQKICAAGEGNVF